MDYDNDINDNDSNISELDINWIKNYEEYNKFYKVNVEFIYTNYFFLNKENEIVFIKQNKLYLSIPNILSRDQLIYEIKQHTKQHNKQCKIKYKLTSLLKCNFNIEVDEINSFLKCKNTDNIFDLYTENITHLNNIIYKDTISCFTDLNCLYIFLKEKAIPKNKTRKLYNNI
jgi:hypothetical protein